jgi:hypothetical protein
MPYYPLFNIPGANGWITISNFPPNNWEISKPTKKLVNLSYVEEGQWKSSTIGSLRHNQFQTFSIDNLPSISKLKTLVLFSLSSLEFPEYSDELPCLDAEQKTLMPIWRSTIGLSTPFASTSYQGEIEPFNQKGSMLTFAPFLQFGEKIENYLIFLNVEKKAISRTAVLGIFNSSTKELKGRFLVKNNDVTVINLDELGFGATDLPLIVCKEMSGIPLYFSRTSDGSSLSLEHTHPPASFVVHGKRFEVQKKLKDIWFSNLNL